MNHHRTLLIAVLCWLAPAWAGAQRVDLTDNPEATPEGEAEALHARGDYAGVTAGGAQLPAVQAAAGTKPATITWPGFQMRPNGGSRVFLQSTAQLMVGGTTSAGKYFLHLGDARIAGETNRFPLETRFFNTPVTRAMLRVGPKGTVLELDLRADVTPEISGEQAPSGFYFVYIDFPPGDYLSNADLTSPGKTSTRAPAPVATPGTGAMPDHLEGDIGGSASGRASGSAHASGQVRVDTSMDAERPPGMGKVKAGGKAKGEAKGSLSF